MRDPFLVRAMVKCLIDHDVDPFDQTKVITRLMCAGYLAREITANYDDVVQMTTIRKGNALRNKVKKVFQ
jgi:hypothetical protein